jgi:hypothetical protein
MSLGAKHADGNGIVVFAGPPGDDGWREAVAYFKSAPFDQMATLSVGVRRRMHPGEWCVISDPQVEVHPD